MTKHNLPTIAELTQDIDTAFKNDKLNLLLNQNPPHKWVIEHQFIKGWKYLPIDKIEYLLRRIFKQFKIEVTGQGTAFNGVYVTVRVHFLNPTDSKWYYHDGIGACQLQTAKGKSPADLASINNGAISMAFPTAKSLAIKDACDHLGRLFGGDLNRKDLIPYEVDKNLEIKSNAEKLKMYENQNI
jgi:hypothetical protein